MADTAAVETTYEKHNRIAEQMAMDIATNFLDPVDQFIVLESICAAIIGTMPFRRDIRSTALEDAIKMLSDGVLQRIRERAP